jgi:hypothetical protein
MIDYGAGSRGTPARVPESFSATATNSGRIRAVTGGGMSMNVNTGGPHLLLFERDQQLTALLMSEFQLAGYECHAARTAVEVFDAIARYPIRLVLVDLAQAAAGRREFWVALDAQRRGRGVQVFTFRCINLAGYGPDDPEERSRTVLADLEVDGMLGVMNLVNAIRSRLPGAATGSFARAAAPAQPTVSTPDSSTGNTHRPQQPENRLQGDAPSSNRQVVEEPAAPPPAAAGISQSTAPLPSVPPTGQSAPLVTPTRQEQRSAAGVPVTSTFTDKIRAVI